MFSTVLTPSGQVSDLAAVAGVELGAEEAVAEYLGALDLHGMFAALTCLHTPSACCAGCVCVFAGLWGCMVSLEPSRMSHLTMPLQQRKLTLMLPHTHCPATLRADHVPQVGTQAAIRVLLGSTDSIVSADVRQGLTP